MKFNLRALYAPIIRFFAISELVLLLCIALPSITTPLVAVIVGISRPSDAWRLLRVQAGGLLAYLGALLLLASVFDFVRLQQLGAKRVPSRVVQKLDEALVNMGFLRGAKVRSSQIRVVMRDLSIGAQIRGILRPRIIISGGMLVALTAKAPIAGAILAHELAHVKNYDRLFTGVILVFGFEILLSVFVPLRSDLEFYLFVYIAAHIYVMFWLLGYLSRRREYFADALAFVLVDSPAVYIAALTSAGSSARHGSSFFHPELRDRVVGLCEKSPVLYPRLAVILFWVLCINASSAPWISVSGFDGAADWFEDLKVLNIVILGKIGLILEASKILMFSMRRSPINYLAVANASAADTGGDWKWYETLFLIVGFFTPQSDVALRLKWTTSGALVSIISFMSLGQGTPVLRSLFLSGLLLGPAQWWAYRKRARGVGWWFVGTSIGWIIGALFAAFFVIPSFIVPGLPPVMRMDEGLIYVDRAVPIMAFILYGAFGGFGAGVVQWITVWRNFSGGMWWIIFTTASGVFSGALSGSVFSRMEQGEVRAIDALASSLFLINGFAVGLVGGGIAVWLKRKQKS